MLNERYMDKLKEKWWTKKLKCSKIEDQQDGISIANIGGVFIVILVGIAMACVILFFEYWWFKYKRYISRPQIVIEAPKDVNATATNSQSSITIAHDQSPNEPRRRKSPFRFS